MKRHAFTVLFFILPSGTAAADDVLWSYTLTELPGSWGQYGFEFSSEGANAHHVGWWYPKGHVDVDCALMVTQVSTVPQDADSLVLHIPQHTYLYAGTTSGTAYASVTLEMLTDGTASEVIWSHGVSSYGNESVEDSLPIHVSITGLDPGQFLQFMFTCYHYGYRGSTVVDLWLYEASLTAHGGLTFTGLTWGSIKRTLGESPN